MKNFLAFCSFIILFNGHSRAQLILSDNTTPLEIQTSVLQLDQFIGRFSYQLDFLNKPVTDEFVKKYSRELVISFLFDQEDKRFDTTFTRDEAYIDLVKEFIYYVVENNLSIKRDDHLYAQLQGRFLYSGKLADINLLLQYHYHGENAFSWKIIDVYCSEFDFAGKQDISKYIPPTSDETGFMSLQRVFEDVENLGNYTDTMLIQNQLPIFLYLLSEGKIKLQEIKGFHYIYLGIKGWCMEIKNFQREGYNTGWLISDLYKYSGKKPLMN